MHYKISLLVLCLSVFLFGFQFSAYAENLVEEVIDVSNSYIEYTGGYANNLMIFDCNGKRKIFKEHKINPKINVEEIVNFYFGNVSNCLSENEKILLIEKLSITENKQKFINMGWIHHKDSPIYAFLNFENEFKGDLIGIPEPISDTLKKEMPNFLKYASRELAAIRIQNGGSSQNYPDGPLRSLATFRLAKLLDLSDMIVDTKYVVLQKDKKDYKSGILMEMVDGLNQTEFLNMEYKNLPDLQRNFSKLQIFDAICMQNDHGPHNYLIKIDKNSNCICIKAFDNDNSFPCNTDLKNFCFYLSPILTNDDKINLPFIDKSLAQKVLDLDCELVKKELKDLIPKYEIDATVKRIEQIKKAINNTINEREKFLLSKTEWNDSTVNEELSKKWFRTYLKRFLKVE